MPAILDSKEVNPCLQRNVQILALAILTKTVGRKKMPPPASTAGRAASSVPSSTPASGLPRPPHIIVIGTGIADLACACELSEQWREVLVLEARQCIGERIRTIDLMLNKEWKDVDKSCNDEPPSELFKVQKWTLVDVGGAFIIVQACQH